MSELMVQGRGGDKDAYHRLLLGITPYLRTIASRAHRNASDAEDTVQDILLTLHQVRQTYDPSRPFKPWLAGIARHRIADRLRALGRVAAGEVVLNAGLRPLPPPSSGVTEDWIAGRWTPRCSRFQRASGRLSRC